MSLVRIGHAPAGTRIMVSRHDRGFGSAVIPYDRGMDLKARAEQAAADLARAEQVAQAMKDSPFLSRGNEEVLAGYIARAHALRNQILLITVTEASRDTARVNYDEGQVLDMLSAAESVVGDNPAGDMRTQVKRRAALGGFATMAVVFGGLYLLSRKR